LRGTTEMGEIGESIVEMDNVVGTVMDELKNLGMENVYFRVNNKDDKSFNFPQQTSLTMTRI